MSRNAMFRNALKHLWIFRINALECISNPIYKNEAFYLFIFFYIILLFYKFLNFVTSQNVNNIIANLYYIYISIYVYTSFTAELSPAFSKFTLFLFLTCSVISHGKEDNFRKGIVLNTVIDTLTVIDINEKIRLADTPQEHPLGAIISIKGSFFPLDDILGAQCALWVWSVTLASKEASPAPWGDISQFA